MSPKTYAALAVLVCSAWSLAEQPSTVFTVTSTLVQADAVVTDSKGRYVNDLKADDFEIYQDGKLQNITNFSYVLVTTPNPSITGTKPSSSPDAVPYSTSAIKPEDVRRTIVLMVDDLRLSFVDMAYVRYALQKFVERQMQPGDLVAVCRTGGGSNALQQFTTDKRILLATIKGLRWNSNGVAGIDYFQAYGQYGQALPVAANARDSTASLREDDYFEELRRSTFTVGTLGAINDVVGALHQMPGRKSVVLVSDGLSLAEHDPLVIDAFRKLVDRANRSGTVIYSVHAAGITYDGPDAQDNIHLDGSAEHIHDLIGSLTDVGGGITRDTFNQGRDVENQIAQQGMADLAARTGGFSYENGNDMNWGLGRILMDQSGYYLIGYKPDPSLFNEKYGLPGYHHITVKVKRAGLHVRSRTGFFGQTDQESAPRYLGPIQRMQAAMLSPFQSSGIHLRLTALYAEVPRHGTVVRNLLHIDGRDIAFQVEADGSAKGSIQLLAVATGAGLIPLEAVAPTYQFKVTAEQLKRVKADGIPYTLDVPVRKRGAYQIRVAVRDPGTGLIGSASQFIEIPDPKKLRVALTSIVLQDGEAPSVNASATRQMKRGGELEYFCEIQKGAADNLASKVRILRDGVEVYSGPAKSMRLDGGKVALTGRLKLNGAMSPGDYYLELVASNPADPKRATATQWTDFEVTP
jgi:VWFA-related protein